jgi:hypothetical protein
MQHFVLDVRYRVAVRKVLRDTEETTKQGEGYRRRSDSRDESML